MNSPTEWWRSFFSGLAVESWLNVANKDQNTLEADFIAQELAVSPPAEILDVPCGGGRLCHELAARGFHMTGVDLATEFLKAARTVAIEEPGSVAWEQREMRDLPWVSRFDGAFTFGNSFGYLDEQGNLEFLKSVARTLKTGARFVFETGYVTETLLPVLQPRGWFPTGDVLMLSQREYDHVDSRLYVEYTFVRAGELEKHTMSARIYSYRELMIMIEKAGFHLLNAYGSFNREPFRLGSPRLILVVAKS